MKLARDKSCTLVYAKGVNAFFVANDLLHYSAEFSPAQLNRSIDLRAVDTRQRPCGYKSGDPAQPSASH